MSDTDNLDLMPESGIVTKRDLLKALEHIGDDDHVIIGVFLPKDDETDQGFYESGEKPAETVNGDSDDDDDPFVYTGITSMDVTETEGEEPKRTALALTIDLSGDDDEEDDDEEDEEPSEDSDQEH